MVSITNTRLHPACSHIAVVITEHVYLRKCFLSLGLNPFWRSFLGFQVHAFPSQPLKVLASSGTILSQEKAGLTRCPDYRLCSASRKQPGIQEGGPRDGIRGLTLLASGCLVQRWLHGLPSWQEGCGGQSGCLYHVGAWKRGGLVQEHMDASEPLMLLGAAIQSDPEPSDFGRFSGWHVEELT